ncbi:WAT1-related protein At4g08290-like isoform X1 [Cajanus cajan]|uniref:WAT1-related protein At4g08290-like isoform X1 n=1 Tax=Cajanus cajan TaxID=3821 RepID=UPI00098DBE81|nr:WAT1-related protein At4g08290-like isoform X1 [Cajanus cajan]
MGEICYSSLGKNLTKAKPYLLTVGLQFGFAGAYIFTMASLKIGMSRYVFVVYRNAFAALALAPFAFIFERKIRPKITLPVFLQIIALGFLEPVIDQGFTFLGMQYTSASFASAVVNATPSVTFILAVILRLERVNFKEVRSLAKVIGTLVTFGGALLMTLYKGPLINLFYSPNTTHHQDVSHTPQDLKHWVSGTLFLLLGCFSWASFIILQSITLKRYPAELSLSSLVCLSGALQASVVALVATRHSGLGAWALGWDFKLYGPLYTGVVTSGITYYVQGLVLQSKGPVFFTAFNPLCMIITCVLGSFLFAEQLHLGSIIGAIVIAMGLYSVVWGKGKDCSDPTPPKHTETQPLPITSSHI